MPPLETVTALPVRNMPVGYSGLPERSEKKRLEEEWQKKVRKVVYRDNEYWILKKQTS